ncbi:Gypsy retrotransposon integrase-like protein 1, partial [Mucuna pruriens]
MASTFEDFTLLHVPRDQNERADLLTKLASTQKREQQKSIIHESLSVLTIDRHKIWSIEGKLTWMGPFITCVDGEEEAYIIWEVHEGVCGMLIRGHALASKIAKARYYWPTLSNDCMNYVKRCDKCQRFAETHKAPPKHLYPVTSPWPFYKWGVNILGPFLVAPGQINYFTKWVEVESIATISLERIKRFFWKKIIYRFGIPTEIVSDNGTQFASRVTTEFCEGLKIKQLFTSVEHPQSNGQAEAANKVILRGLQKHLEEAKGRWAKELPQVLWSYHTTPHSTTKETPFRLTFDIEAMIPVEIREPSPQTTMFELSENEEELRANLDMLQEIREIAHVREYAIKERVARKYDKKVAPCNFKPQDLVLRKKTQGLENNKLTPI